MRLRMACAALDREVVEEDADEAKPQGSGRCNDSVGGAAVLAQLSRSKRGLFLDLFVVLPVMQVRCAWLERHWSH